jgi:hypothetical protein
VNTLIALLTGGGLVAVSTFLTAWQTSRNASKRDQAAHTHQLQMAAEDRRQDRLERAYTDLGIYLSWLSEWARSVHPFIGPVPAPDPFPPQERRRIEALVANHGSPKLRALLDQVHEAGRKIEYAGHVITMADQSPNPGQLADEARKERLALEGTRKLLQQAADRVYDQMKAELDGQQQPALGG